MKPTSKFFSLFAICAMLLIANTDALAQKKPKLKGIAKQLVGTWVLDNMDFKLDAENASEEMKTQFAQMEGQKDLIKTMMGGKMRFTFNANGTYTTVNELQGSEDKSNGTWSVEGNKLVLVPEGREKRITDITLEKETLKMFLPKDATKGLMTTLILSKKTK